MDSKLLVQVMAIFLLLTLATCTSHGYANAIDCKINRLALAGYKNIGAQTAASGFFVCNPSMRSHIFMVKLEGDASARAGCLCCQSANPFQLCHHHLAVTGKASIQNIGAHPHA